MQELPETQVQSRVGKNPGGGNGNPLHILAWRMSPMDGGAEGCSPWGCKRAEVGRGGSRAGWAPGSGSDVRPRVRVAFRAPQGARGRRERHLYSQSTACGSTSQTSTGRGGLPWWSSLPSTAGDAGPIPGQVTEIPHCHRATKPDPEQGPGRS